MKGKTFREPVFHRVVNGQITQFREVMKPQPKDCFACPYCGNGYNYLHPRFKPGETVYLKEPYIDEENDWVGNLLQSYLGRESQKSIVRSATQMPERLAKHFIEITGVKAERLHDITDSDCVKEGIRLNSHYDDDVRDEKILIASNHYIVNYADFIDATHGKGTWESNPWMWVYDFKLIR